MACCRLAVTSGSFMKSVRRPGFKSRSLMTNSPILQPPTSAQKQGEE